MTFATADCAQLAACSSSAIPIKYGTLDTCVTTANQNCVNELSAPSTGASPSDRADCAKAIPGWSCSDFLDGQNPPSACSQKSGHLDVAASCAFSSQCESSFCAVTDTEACGACAAPPTAGASCKSLSNCGQGLTCDPLTTACVQLGGTGATCDTAAPCGSGLSCVGADAMTKKSGTCTAAIGTSGTTCDPTLATGPGCDLTKSLTCSFKTKACVTLTFANAGDPCGAAAAADCTDGASCTTTPKKPGDCVAAVSDKGTCTPGVAPCATSERCIVASGSTSGTCEFNDGAKCK